MKIAMTIAGIMLALPALAHEPRTYVWGDIVFPCGESTLATALKFEYPSPQLVLIIQEQCGFGREYHRRHRERDPEDE